MPSRRAVLAAGGVAFTSSLAGCNSTASVPESTFDEPTIASRGRHGSPTNTGTVGAAAVPDGELTVAWTVSLPTHGGHHVPVVSDVTS